MQIPCIVEKDSKETLKAVLRKAYKTQEVMHAPPVAVEHVKNKGMLCYLFNVPDTRVYMPATEVGLPVFNGDLWKYLSLNRQQRHYVKRSMINLLSSAHAFPFIVTHSARNMILLSRRLALPKLDPLPLDSIIEVTVISASNEGAYCLHEGRTVFIPRKEVFYGNPDPRTALKQRGVYRAKITKTQPDYYEASIRAIKPDPWEDVTDTWKGSVRRATVIRKIDNRDAYLVLFAPGILGACNVSPLRERIDPISKHQEIYVSITYINKDRRQIVGHLTV